MATTKKQRDTRPVRITPEELHESHRWIRLDEIAHLPGNPNLGDAESLERSVERFGWFNGIVIHDGVIVVGNHRADQARAKGETGLPGYDLSGFPLSAVERMAMALADNHTTRAGTNDPELLLAAAEGFEGITDLAEVSGLGHIDARILSPDRGTIGIEPPIELDISEEFDHVCPHCGFGWS